MPFFPRPCPPSQTLARLRKLPPALLPDPADECASLCVGWGTSYEALDQGASFSSEQCPEGIIGIAGNTLRCVSFVVGLLSLRLVLCGSLTTVRFFGPIPESS